MELFGALKSMCLQRGDGFAKLELHASIDDVKNMNE